MTATNLSSRHWKHCSTCADSSKWGTVRQNYLRSEERLYSTFQWQNTLHFAALKPAGGCWTILSRPTDLGQGPRPKQNHPMPTEPKQRYRQGEGGCSIYNSAVTHGSQSVDLHKTVQKPRAKFNVAKWGVFYHSARLPVRSRAMICLIKIGDIATMLSTKVIISVTWSIDQFLKVYQKAKNYRYASQQKFQNHTDWCKRDYYITFWDNMSNYPYTSPSNLMRFFWPQFGQWKSLLSVSKFLVIDAYVQ